MHILTPGSCHRKKNIIVVAVVFFSVSTLVIFSSLRSDLRAIWRANNPLGRDARARLPTYDRIIQLESDLPQHNLSLPYPEGKNGRYVKFSNQIQGLGWNNVFSEIILCSHLAWRAKRAYVFQEYIWNIDHYPIHLPEGIQPRTPINALISGPTAGGSWEEGDDTPRSVSADWFKMVCPPEDTEIIKTNVAKDPIRDADGKSTMDHWLKLLNESPKRCVDVVPGENDGFPQTFDLWVISTPKILPLWQDFFNSPVSKLLRTSPLVNSAIERNQHLFFPPSNVSYTNPYAGLMAVHLRRGDYAGACEHLSKWSSTFYGWNLLPHIPDRFEPPPGGGWGTNTPENTALYMKRCFPNEEQILTKITESKLDWETDPASQGNTLRTLYIMTNARKDWLDDIKARLSAAGWSTVVSSDDLSLDTEQTAVAMAVDMDIGRRAAVFIGNGWSSLTSNVVHRRLVDKTELASIRFW